jgi:hypothetical protein
MINKIQILKDQSRSDQNRRRIEVIDEFLEFFINFLKILFLLILHINEKITLFQLILIT